MDSHDKVPSVYSYTPRVGREQNWGSSLGPNAIAMIHTKLELDVSSVSDELDFILKALIGTKSLDFELGVKNAPAAGRNYPDQSPEEIVAEYMTKVFEHLLKEGIFEADALRSRIATDIVITIPTV
jgi:hypothetical protein